MTFFFIGGEDSDFTKLGNCTVDTATTAGRRTAYARCALKAQPAATGEGWYGNLSSPQSSFWFSARYYPLATQGFGPQVLAFCDASGIRRLGIIADNGVLNFYKFNAAGNSTMIGSATVGLSNGVLVKLDISISYGTAGALKCYADGTLIFSYSGNIATDTNTTLSSFVLASGSGGSGGLWSEIICADTDTRSMGLVTAAPSANGSTFSFDSGSYTSVNETTLDDTTVITSGTVGQVAQFAVGASGLTGIPAIKAVCVAARAGKGAAGPQSAKLGVRTAGADYVSSSIPLQSGSLARIQNTFTANPATGNAWTASDLTAAGFNVSIVSDT